MIVASGCSASSAVATTQDGAGEVGVASITASGDDAQLR
jgi:hypothetical protein